MTQGRVTRLKISNQGLILTTKQAETFWEFRPNFQFLEVVFLSKITSPNLKDLFLIKIGTLVTCGPQVLKQQASPTPTPESFSGGLLYINISINTEYFFFGISELV